MNGYPIGALREMLTVQTRTDTADTHGAAVPTWTTLDTIAGELWPIRATERLQLAALQAETAYRFRVHVRGDLRPTMRILWTPSWPDGATAKTLQITGLQPVGDGRLWQQIDCVEVTA